MGQQVQVLQTIRQFASARINYSSVYKEIIKELDEIYVSVNANKLRIQVFSQYSSPSQGLYNFLISSQTLQQFYQTKISEFPTVLPTAQPNLPSALVLKSNPAIGQQETRYELSHSRNILIGRDYQRLSQDFRSQNAQLIALSGYSKISSVHAQIQVVNISDSNSPNWQICDLNTTNGTYINGQRVQGCKILQPRDKITLAYPTASNKAPEFIFQSQSNHYFQDNVQSSQIIDSDLVCLVVAPQQLLSDEEKKFIDVVSKAQVAGLFIIAETSGANNQILQKLNSNLTALQNWLQVQYPLLASNTYITTLELYPFYSKTTLTFLTSAAQQLDSFCQEVLIPVAKNKSQEIIFNNVGLKLSSQINRIEKFINTQEETLKENMQRTEQLLRYCTLEDWGGQVRKAFKQVDEEREVFFSHARTELERAINDLSSGFIPDSLMQRIEKYTEILQPVVTRHQGQVCIQLQPENTSDTHQAMISFCQTQLIQWATEEWVRFCNVYHNGGLNDLLRNSYITLNTLPSLTLSNPFNSPALQIDVRNSIQGSFVEMQNSSSYNEGSANAFGSAARVGMQAAMVVGMTFVSPDRAVFQGVGLVSSLVGLIGSRLSSSEIQKLKLEQAITGLKRTACNYYQAIARYMLSRVMQDIRAAIDVEARKFKKGTDVASEQITVHLNELRIAQEGYRAKLQNLNQDKMILNQIKGIGI